MPFYKSKNIYKLTNAFKIGLSSHPEVLHHKSGSLKDKPKVKKYISYKSFDIE